MGHFFSRAFRRITQCNTASQSTSNQQERKSAEQQHQDKNLKPENPIIAQSIPVGQSIDSADYAAFESSKRGKSINVAEEKENTIDNYGNDQENKDFVAEKSKIGTSMNDNENGDSNAENRQDVEEAVIKIQALVRGHLTRKALKDAHQHSAPNALGQSQFDEDSLTGNPPAAVFLASSPLNLYRDGSQQSSQVVSSESDGRTNSVSQGGNNTRSPLESIAEVNETKQETQQQTINNNHQLEERVAETTEDRRRKLSSLSSRSASTPAKVDSMPSPMHHSDSRGTSPVPSEANASIDIVSETPTSASIDIMDHNILPTDKMASVLHHKNPVDVGKAGASSIGVAETEPFGEAQPNENNQNNVPIQDNSLPSLVGTPESLDSEEAAAIRIQSAFRGYRSRKNSPYRTKSPKSNALEKRNILLRQEQATVIHENETDEINDQDDSNLEEEAKASQSERRTSRPRTKEDSPLINASALVDEISTKEFIDTVEDNEPPANVNIDTSLDISMKSNERDSILNRSISLDKGERTSEQAADLDTSDDTCLSAALADLESGTRAMSQDANDQVKHEEKLLETPRRLSGKESETSVDLDTDSSFVGAALSLNSEESENQPPTQISLASASTLGAIQESLTTDSTSTNADDHSEALKLINEIDSERLAEELSATSISEVELQDKKDLPDERENECALEEDTDPVDQAETKAMHEGSSTLDEEEQRAIELESDDIERRDPRGHASEDRNSKSPQIRSEPPALDPSGLVGSVSGCQLMEACDSSRTVVKRDENLLDSPVLEDDKLSGISSPALNSSANVSDEEEEDHSDHEQQENDGSPKNQEQQQRPASNGKNRKRNRNKRKGKK